MTLAAASYSSYYHRPYYPYYPQYPYYPYHRGGFGGGSFGVPLMSLYGVPIHRAVATAAGFGVTIAVPSVIGFLFFDIAAQNRPPLTYGAVNLVAFAVVIAMTLLTAPLGVKLAHAMDPKPLKRVFAIFLTLVAINMLRKALGW